MRLWRSAALLVAFVLAGAAPAGAQVNPFGDTLDLTTEDIEMMKAAAAELFTDDAARLGDTRTWSNPATGNAGSVSLVKTFEHQGLPCKRVQHAIKQQDRADQVIYQFARCRASNGTWQLL
jgi:surface antigen